MNAPVAGAAPARLDLERAEGDVQIVVDDKKLLGRCLIFFHQAADRSAAQIHEHVGLGEDDIHPVNGTVPVHTRTFPDVQKNVRPRREMVDRAIPDVVAGCRIAVTGIAQTEDQLHQGSTTVCGVPALLF